MHVRAHAGSDAPPPSAAPCRRLDLALDLAPGLRRATLGELAGLDDAALGEAWVLLEPRPAAGAAAVAAAASGAGAVAGAGAEQVSQARAQVQAGASQAAAAVAGAPPALLPASARDTSAGTWRQQQRRRRRQVAEPPAKRARTAPGVGQPPRQAPPLLSPSAPPQRAPHAAAPVAVAPPAAALAPGSLVWASFAGTWWPGLLLAPAAPVGGGAPGTASQLQVEVFVAKGMRVLLPPASVSAFGEQREARTSRLLRAQSDLGRRAVERAARLAAGG